MKPSVRNVFMKTLTSERVVPDPAELDTRGRYLGKVLLYC